jgi:two-component system OmpR family response regulator
MPRICKILIVEDHDEVRELLTQLLELEGFDFTAVETGAGMRAALDEDDHDLVIIDVLLPGGEDGFALAEAAREMGCGVILITGDHRHAERLDQSGHHYLLKPFGVNDLVGLVSRVLAEISSRCVRRQRSDGSSFPLRTG